VTPNRSPILLRIGLGALLPAALLVAAIVPPLALWSHLPARLADHWGFGGTANGSMPKPFALGVSFALAALGASLSSCWALGLPRPAAAPVGGRRRVVASGLGLLGTGVLFCGLGAATSLVVTFANLDAPTWHQAHPLGAGALIGLSGGPLALLVAALYLARRAGEANLGHGRLAETPARLGLSKGERALWVGTARSRWAPPVALVALGASVALGAGDDWALALSILAVSPAVWLLASVRVTASASGVKVAYGPLRWPVTRIPLRRVTHAEAVEVVPAGWGYRGSLRLFGRAAVIVRKGEGLELALTSGQSFVVTVDGAVTAAALLNDELARARGADGEA
jgi:hypothetical protein